MQRTDLALEAKEMYHEKAGEITEIEGVKATSEEKNGVTITVVEVLNEKGQKALNKPIGRYVTIEIPKFIENGQDFYYIASEIIKDELKKMLPMGEGNPVLVAGLGNRSITPDALGPKVVDRLIVTRHLYEMGHSEIEGVLGSLCAVSPGVLGITGIETSEMIKGVVKLVKPSAVVAVDALASRRAERVSTTIQISDTGISPGAGVGNNRKRLDRQSLGLPVIAIGVPMVVDASTLAFDVIAGACEEMDCGQLAEELMDKIALNAGNMMVTPKDIDKIIERMADIISAGVNTAVHNIKNEDIYLYMG